MPRPSSRACHHQRVQSRAAAFCAQHFFVYASVPDWTGTLTRTYRSAARGARDKAASFALASGQPFLPASI